MTFVVTVCVSNSFVSAAISYRLGDGGIDPPNMVLNGVDVTLWLLGVPGTPPIAFCCDSNFLCIARGSKIGGDRSKRISCALEVLHGIPPGPGAFSPNRRELGSIGGSRRPHLVKSGNFGICFGGGNTTNIKVSKLFRSYTTCIHCN